MCEISWLFKRLFTLSICKKKDYNQQVFLTSNHQHNVTYSNDKVLENELHEYTKYTEVQNQIIVLHYFVC